MASPSLLLLNKHRDGLYRRIFRIGDLKIKYQDACLAAHERARLGANDDKSKAKLAKESRLVQIQKIANVEMMPTPQLRDFENKLLALKTCFQLDRRIGWSAGVDVRAETG
jgi:Family of unknown function (DUF6079)